jgi:hypothetical protein
MPCILSLDNYLSLSKSITRYQIIISPEVASLTTVGSMVLLSLYTMLLILLLSFSGCIPCMYFFNDSYIKLTWNYFTDSLTMLE